MARTHYFPPDEVHYLWDEANEPVLEIESGPIWSSLTSRVETMTVSPPAISSTGSLPVSHWKWTRSSGK